MGGRTLFCQLDIAICHWLDNVECSSTRAHIAQNQRGLQLTRLKICVNRDSEKPAKTEASLKSKGHADDGQLSLKSAVIESGMGLWLILYIADWA